MKAIILLNGEPYRGEIAEGAYVYCCDGAYKWAKDKVRIDENLGDYDSLQHTGRELAGIIIPIFIQSYHLNNIVRSLLEPVWRKVLGF